MITESSVLSKKRYVEISLSTISRDDGEKEFEIIVQVPVNSLMQAISPEDMLISIFRKAAQKFLKRTNQDEIK